MPLDATPRKTANAAPATSSTPDAIKAIGDRSMSHLLRWPDSEAAPEALEGPSVLCERDQRPGSALPESTQDNEKTAPRGAVFCIYAFTAGGGEG